MNYGTMNYLRCGRPKTSSKSGTGQVGSDQTGRHCDTDSHLSLALASQRL